MIDDGTGLRELAVQWRHNAQGCGRKDAQAAGAWRSCARELEAALSAVAPPPVLEGTDTEAMAVEDWDGAMRVARVAVYGADGRGMIGRGRNHLQERVARALLLRAAKPTSTDDSMLRAREMFDAREISPLDAAPEFSAWMRKQARVHGAEFPQAALQFNATAELIERLAASPAAPAQPAMQAAPIAFVTDGDVYTLIGHAAVMRMRGESDMPAYSLDLAQRIALTIGDRHLADRCDELAALPPPPTGE